MELFQVHGLDLIIIGLLIGGAVRGAVTGHLQQVLDIGAAFVAFAVALGTMHPISDLFAGLRTVPDDTEALVVSFCLVFVFVFSLLYAVLRIGTHPQTYDTEVPRAHRIVGGAAGVVLTLLLMSTAFTALGQVDRPSEQYRAGAILYHPVSRCVPELWQSARQVLPVDALPAYFDRRRQLANH